MDVYIFLQSLTHSVTGITAFQKKSNEKQIFFLFNIFFFSFFIYLSVRFSACVIVCLNVCVFVYMAILRSYEKFVLVILFCSNIFRQFSSVQFSCYWTIYNVRLLLNLYIDYLGTYVYKYQRESWKGKKRNTPNIAE